MNIREELARRVLIFDGGMGTMLQAAGLPAGREPELWNLERPEAVKDVHRQYLSAGADIVTTNTFGANAVKLSGRPVEELAAAGVTLARQAVAEHGGGFVALDLGPTGRLLRPMGDLSFEEAVAAYVPAVRAGAAAGADLVLIETMSDLYEAKAAVLAAKEHCDLPIFVSVVLDQTGRMLTGGDLAADRTGAAGGGRLGTLQAAGPPVRQRQTPRLGAAFQQQDLRWALAQTLQAFPQA